MKNIRIIIPLLLFSVFCMAQLPIGTVRKPVYTDNGGNVLSTPITFSNQVSMTVAASNNNDLVRYKEFTNATANSTPAGVAVLASNQTFYGINTFSNSTKFGLSGSVMTIPKNTSGIITNNAQTYTFGDYVHIWTNTLGGSFVMDFTDTGDETRINITGGIGGTGGTGIMQFKVNGEDNFVGGTNLLSQLSMNGLVFARNRTVGPTSQGIEFSPNGFDYKFGTGVSRVEGTISGVNFVGSNYTWSLANLGVVNLNNNAIRFPNVGFVELKNVTIVGGFTGSVTNMGNAIGTVTNIEVFGSGILTNFIRIP